MSAARPDVVIVIPCLNEAAVLPALLRQQLADTDGIPIIVADGGSTDDSRGVVERLAAEEPRVRLLPNPARIQSAGVNLAVRGCGPEVRWLVRMDAHCDYPTDYVDRLLATAEAQHVTSVVVPMVSRGTTCFQVAAATAQNSRLGTGGSAHRHVGRGGLVDHGHHALIDRALFESTGGYREDMPTNEDAELDARMTAAGGRIWLEPSLALVYYPRSTPGALWRQYWKYGRGRARTLQLHRARPKLRQMLPLAVPAAAALALATPVHAIFAVPLSAWALLCLGGGAAIGRRQGGCALLSGVPAMIMHLAWGLGFLTRMILRR
ncbi:glycosyltransferase family 2 protein [uncultured Sphingomonas sp.]|uniref:glycosyltransferase family 2 protein n=1 Tax=uncultured Sphingomonas sp. TaxID=158754 RepID=UPI0035CC5626